MYVSSIALHAPSKWKSNMNSIDDKTSATRLNWKQFAAGVIFGLVLGLAVFIFCGQRYRVQTVNPGPRGLLIVRLDTWTGRSWKFDGSAWQPVGEVQQ